MISWFQSLLSNPTCVPLHHGRHHGHDTGSKHDTVYHLTMRTVGGFARFCGFKAEDPSGLMPSLMYMVSHAAACLVTVLVSPVFFFSFWAHTAAGLYTF